MTTVPTISTDRLSLRAHSAHDFEQVATFFADAAHSGGYGGPLTRNAAWRWFASSIGHWQLRGFGLWTVDLRADQRPCGIVGLWKPEGLQEPELSWMLFQGFQGKNIAYEAALAARAYAFDTLGFNSLTSNITPGNPRSVKLAERLGATFDSKYFASDDSEILVYRHPATGALK